MIATGFIARTPEGVPTTLKRNGSDYSATIFGAMLIAKTITIWTDVDGVFSADPRKVKEAVCLESLSYNEAWELSYFGANVLHPRTTLPAMRYHIPVVLRNYFNQAAPGTSICDQCDVETGGMNPIDINSDRVNFIKGLATIEDITIINVEGTGMVGVPGTANAVFQTVKEAGCNVVMISQASSEHSICFAVRPTKPPPPLRRSKRFEKAIAAGRIKAVEPSTSVPSSRRSARTCARPRASPPCSSRRSPTPTSTSSPSPRERPAQHHLRVSKKDIAKALRAVHGRFYLSKTVMSVGIVGPGLVGKTLLRQMKEQLASLKTDYNVDLRVVAVAGQSKMLLVGESEFALDLDAWEDSYAEGQALDMEAFVQCVTANAPNAVIIDCSASEDVALEYKDWLQRGINVVTPNKKANSGPLPYYKELRNIQRNSYTHYFYEGTVGAGLPILSTLNNLTDSGDRINKVEGIFSGTLSYIFNTYGADDKFSDIVKTAKELGYTEPDPRDDLSGTDVARKVVILARECGIDIELDDVPVESLVPEALRDVASVEEFMEKLPEYDDEMAGKCAEAAAAGEKLRYVGVVDVENKTGSVELRRYSGDHPFGQLSGSDNIISFETKRYVGPSTLVVRGPGAGAEVTAGGVFGDVLRVAQYLGAPS